MKKSKQIMLGILIPLALWLGGILSCGSIFLGDELNFWNGCKPLSVVYPLIISAYAILSSFMAKKKDRPYFFKASQAILLIPIIGYVGQFIVGELNEALGYPSVLGILMLILMFTTPPFVSVIFGAGNFNTVMMFIAIALIVISIIAAFFIFHFYKRNDKKTENKVLEEQNNNSDL